MLYNLNIASLALGCLMKQPSLLTLPQYPLSKSDFSCEQFHKVLYVAINNLVHEGAQEITEVEIENIVKNHPVSMEILQDNNYLDFIANVKELCVLENYGLYYNTVRKLSLLREMQEDGFDIKEFYDELQDESGQVANLEKWSIQDILNRIETKGAQLRNRYDVKYVREEIRAGEDSKARLAAFKEHPAFGAGLQSGYLNTIYNGWSRGHLILRAGASGSGKTRGSVADLCQVGIMEMWDEEAQDFIVNPNYQSPTLFIATEQKLLKEVEPMFYAKVAGVEYYKITNGLTTPEEDKRLDKAGEIIYKSNLTLTSMPNFTVKSLERKLKEKVESEGIAYAVFDYMEAQGDASAEFKMNNAISARQDLVLLYLTTELKRMAEDYNVGLISGMQLNDSWKTAHIIDESALAGSKAVKFKIDNGSIMVPTKYLKKELKILEPYFKRRGFGENRTPLPNVCETIFKARYSLYGDQVLKLWSYFDKGTMQRHDFFVTDEDNQILDIKPTIVKGDDF